MVEAITNTNTSSTTANQLLDADSDTKIQVEESSDEDKIRFDVAGTEVTERTGQQRRNQWPFLRRAGERTTVQTQEVNNRTR